MHPCPYHPHRLVLEEVREIRVESLGTIMFTRLRSLLVLKEYSLFLYKIGDLSSKFLKHDQDGGKEPIRHGLDEYHCLVS